MKLHHQTMVSVDTLVLVSRRCRCRVAQHQKKVPRIPRMKRSEVFSHMRAACSAHSHLKQAEGKIRARAQGGQLNLLQ